MLDFLLYRPFRRSSLQTNRIIKEQQRLWDMLSLVVPPRCHQTVGQGRYRKAFDAVTVTDVTILILGKDYLHSQACYLQALPYTPYVFAISIYF